jgi:hypothetical protein
MKAVTMRGKEGKEEGRKGGRKTVGTVLYRCGS